MKRVLLLLLLLSNCAVAQDDLLSSIDQDSIPSSKIDAVFKGLKIVNLESTKLAKKKSFYFIVSHRFEDIQTGIDEFYGLDNSVTRLQFVYGISDGLNVSVSRSSLAKVYDVSVKYRILQQEKDKMPFTLVGYNQMAINTSLDKELLKYLEFKHRLSYVIQVLLSRKFTKSLSLEIVPTFFHENYVIIDEQNNSQFAFGLGGRYKLTKRFSLNMDYALHLNRADTSPFKNPLSVGVDIETGGHVFQLLFTNAQQMIESGFLGQAAADWFDGHFYFGFNLSRVF